MPGVQECRFPDNPSPVHVPAVEIPRVRFEIPFQIVAANIKRISRRHAEQPVQRLRLHFNIFKLTLRLGIASVRAIPVTEINQLTARFPGNTPVRNLMNCAGIKAMSKDDSVIRYFRISRR